LLSAGRWTFELVADVASRWFRSLFWFFAWATHPAAGEHAQVDKSTPFECGPLCQLFVSLMVELLEKTPLIFDATQAESMSDTQHLQRGVNIQ
jgi:hypothetical protein